MDLPIRRPVCIYKANEDFWNVQFSCVMIECWAVDSDMDGVTGFSSYLFAVLIPYFEVGDVGTGLVVGFIMNVNCTGYMTAMVFLFSRHLLDSLM